MDEEDDPDLRIDLLESLAPKMPSQRARLFARRRYHLMADAIYWSDEIPKNITAEEESILRFILHHRTQLIVEDEEADYASYWNEALKVFPHWIGFHSERSKPNQRLVKWYKKVSGSSTDEALEAFEES